MKFRDEITMIENALEREVHMRENEIRRLLKRYDLENIDLEAEYEKIQRKESYLSAKKRAVVEDIVRARRMNKQITEIVQFDRAFHAAPRGAETANSNNTEGENHV